MDRDEHDSVEEEHCTTSRGYARCGECGAVVLRSKAVAAARAEGVREGRQAVDREQMEREIARLNAVLQQTHVNHCIDAYTKRGMHAPECLQEEMTEYPQPAPESAGVCGVCGKTRDQLVKAGPMGKVDP